VQVIK